MEKKRNRNAIRSVNMIIDAYIELYKELPSDKITVTAVVDRAGLNRSTFYAHFRGPDDVQQVLEQKLVDDLLESIKEFGINDLINDPKRLIEIVSGRIESKMKFVKLMFEKHSAARWLESLREAVIEKFMSDPDAMSCADRDELLIRVRYCIGGYISLCRDCITNRIDKPLGSLTDEIAAVTVKALGK